VGSGSHRLAAGGRIDRTRSISFRLEGRRLQGFGGDTLASALLAQGVSLLGRSFKYHRPRGLLAAGVEEPNGLLTLGEGGGRTPNVPATTVELSAGIVASRQNGWPSVDLDLMAALTACATPLLGAGFYYKTFMGPRRGSWMFYEPHIRRAAGLGQGTHAPDPDRYETRHAFTDVLVIGAGPAGLAAARAAGQAGARVLLIEQDFALGGSLLGARTDSPLEPWRSALEAELRTMPNVAIGLRTTALGVYDGNTLGLVERHQHARPDASRGVAREVIITLRTRAIVYATGATERPLVFADNDRPGIMLSSAVRAYLNRYAVAAGRRAVLATNNDSAYATALDLATAGVPVTVLDERARPDAAELLRGAGIELRAGVRVLSAAARSRAWSSRRAAGRSAWQPTSSACRAAGRRWCI
jgi:methylglutamate dehydrogenase subunit C